MSNPEMHDGKMLELTARSMGYQATQIIVAGHVYSKVVDASGKGFNWCPFKDDAQAFRLLVSMPDIDIAGIISDAKSAATSDEEMQSLVRRWLVECAAHAQLASESHTDTQLPAP